MTKPYYSDDVVTIYHGDALDVIRAGLVEAIDLVLTDPPYPNKAGHFDEHVSAARGCSSAWRRTRVSWSSGTSSRPPVPLPLVARHIWHRTNTNRPDNYEAIYEFADEAERRVRVPVRGDLPRPDGLREATGHPTQKNLKLMQRS
jgi:DNA modification methylase